MTFCDKSVLSSVAGRIQLHWSILVAASLGCAVAHWAKINFRILCHFETDEKFQL